MNTLPERSNKSRFAGAVYAALALAGVMVAMAPVTAHAQSRWEREHEREEWRRHHRPYYAPPPPYVVQAPPPVYYPQPVYPPSLNFVIPLHIR